MRKILKIALTTLIACITAIAISVCVYAETEDVELSVVRAKESGGGWGQSVTYDKTQFDCARITSDTIVYVEFELADEWPKTTTPVELILQNYTNANPQIWAKVEPYEWDETSASFDYDSMVEIYGSDDLSTVDNLWIGDTGMSLKVTKLTISNCEVIEVETTVSETEEETTTTTTEAETTTEATTEATEAATTAATTAAAQTESGEGGGITSILIIVVIAAVVIAGVIVTLIVVKKNKNRFY